jgi:hypothetical protein
VLHRVTLRAECGIPQARATVFVGRPITKTTAAIPTSSALASRTPARIAVAGSAIAAISGARAAAGRSRGIALHARAIVAADSHHGTNRLLGGC